MIADDLHRIADSLDDMIDDSPQTRLSQGVPWLWFTLNREGCISLAARLLRRVAAPVPADGSNPSISLHDIEQVQEHVSDLRIFRICRAESFDVDAAGCEPTPTAMKDRLALLGCAVIAFVAVGIFASGVWYWISLFLSDR